MSSPHSTVPTIDIGGLFHGSPADVVRISNALGAAARGIGFFSIVNHGVPRDVIDSVFEASAAFFKAPEAIKESVSIEGSPIYRGYSRIGYEQFDPSHPADAKESFDIGPDLAPDDPSIVAGLPFRGVNLWPDVPERPDFRSVVVEYADALKNLANVLHRAIAIDLGLDDHFFAQFYERPLSVLRLLRYPPHPVTFDGGLHGAAPHTDYGFISLLLQDDAGGLEVRTRDGAWIQVAPDPTAIVCNIGDCLMRWTNDAYVSTLHRVVNLSGRERYSIVLFDEPGPDTPISTLPSCIDEGQPTKYPAMQYGEYLAMRLSEAYPPPPAAAGIEGELA